MPRPKFKGKATKKSCRKYSSKRIKHEFEKGEERARAIAIGLSETRQEKPACARYIGRKR